MNGLDAFVGSERDREDSGIPVLQFKKGERRVDVMAERRKEIRAEEGVVFVGKAQENNLFCEQLAGFIDDRLAAFNPRARQAVPVARRLPREQRAIPGTRARSVISGCGHPQGPVSAA